MKKMKNLWNAFPDVHQLFMEQVNKSEEIFKFISKLDMYMKKGNNPKGIEDVKKNLSITPDKKSDKENLIISFDNLSKNELIRKDSVAEDELNWTIREYNENSDIPFGFVKMQGTRIREDYPINYDLKIGSIFYTLNRIIFEIIRKKFEAYKEVINDDLFKAVFVRDFYCLRSKKYIKFTRTGKYITTGRKTTRLEGIVLNTHMKSKKVNKEICDKLFALKECKGLRFRFKKILDSQIVIVGKKENIHALIKILTKRNTENPKKYHTADYFFNNYYEKKENQKSFNFKYRKGHYINDYDIFYKDDKNKALREMLVNDLKDYYLNFYDDNPTRKKYKISEEILRLIPEMEEARIKYPKYFDPKKRNQEE